MLIDPTRLKGFTPDEFERICLNLVKRIIPADQVIRRGGITDPDQGIDIEATSATKRIGIQCKTAKISVATMRDTLRSLIRYPHQLDQFILMCAQHPAPKALDEFREWTKGAVTVAGDIASVEIWDPDRILSELERHPDMLQELIPSKYTAPFFVPEAQSFIFSGREKILSEIDRWARHGEKQPILITGMPGIGKTAFINYYLHSRRDRFTGGVFWIDGQEEVIPQLARFAIAQGLSLPTTSDYACAKAFLNQLGQAEHAVLIIDDIDRPNLVNEHLIDNISLSSIGCQILLTSRFSGVIARGASKIALEGLSESDAIELLASTSLRSNITIENSSEQIAARELCKKLGYLPLALEIAGSFLAINQEISVSDYLQQIWREGALSSVDKSELATLHLVQRHEASVASALRMAYQSIRDEDAKNLFQILCALPENQKITREIVVMMTGGLVDEDRRKVQRSLAWLENCGLITVDDQGIVNLHPLAKWYGLSLIDDSRRSALASSVADTVKKSIEGGAPSKKQKAQIMKPGPKIFLCYAGPDRTITKKLFENLQREGFQPWMDKKSILPGQDWEFEVRRAIESSDFFIACISKHFENRTYGHKEIKLALDVLDTMPEGTIYLIPVRLEECKVDSRLSTRQWVDLYATDGHNMLIKALRSKQ